MAQLPKFALEAIAFGGITLFILLLLITKEELHQVLPTIGLFAFAGYRIMPAFQEIFNSFAQMQFNQVVLKRVHKDITSGSYSVQPYIVSRTNLPKPLPFRKRD